MQYLINTVPTLRLILRECFAHANCLVVLASTLFIFVIDLHLPLGVAAGAPYALVIFATLWVGGIGSTYAIAMLGFVFTIAGYFLSPGIEAPFHTVIINRALTLMLIVCAAAMVIRIKKAHIDIAALMNRVLTDPITGFKNKQAFETELSGEIQRCRRYERQLSLAIVEIQNQSIINKIAQEIRANIRATDFPYSINRDTFAIVFTETSLAESKSVCEIIRKQIGAKQSKQAPGAIKIGIAALDKTDDIAALFERASNALSVAKSNGETAVATLPQVANKDKPPVAAILLRSRSG